MKKLLVSALFLGSCVYGQIIPEEGYPILQERSFNPFSLSLTSVNVSDAHFREETIGNDHLHYVQNNIAFGYAQPFNRYWGIIFGTGYVGTKVKWVQNPDFHETHFGYVNLAIGAFTTAMPNWKWTATFSTFIDKAVLDFGNYVLYQGVIYGEYDISDTVWFDAGFIIEAGLSHGKAWPIIGFCWEPKRFDHLRIHAIYPLDVSVEFDILEDGSLVAAGSLRFLRDRHRVLETEPIPQAIYQYTSTGGEFDIIFRPRPWFSVRGFVGTTFGGDLKVTDRNNHDPNHYKFRSSFYSGFSGAVNF